MDGVGVPDLGDLGERLEDEDERDENRETLLREPSDVPNLKNECIHNRLDTQMVESSTPKKLIDCLAK